MRILFTHRPGGAYGFISQSWINAVAAAGGVAERWDGSRESWDRFQPDAYVGCSGHRQPIPPLGQRGDAKIAIHVNPYCGTSLMGINEPQQAINWVLQQQPDAVFGYGHEQDRCYWENWPVPWAPMATAGDSTIFKDRGLERTVDVAYVGGHWPYKGKNLDRYIVPLLQHGRLRTEVYGWGNWPRGLSRGGIDDADVPGLFCRARTCPCVVEPHTTQWGIDLPERLWKVALCGALVIHDPVHGLDKHMPSAVVANSAADYISLCQHYCKPENEPERAAVAAKQRSEVLDGNTYFHRLAGLFTVLGGPVLQKGAAALLAAAAR